MRRGRLVGIVTHPSYDATQENPIYTPSQTNTPNSIHLPPPQNPNPPLQTTNSHPHIPPYLISISLQSIQELHHTTSHRTRKEDHDPPPCFMYPPPHPSLPIHPTTQHIAHTKKRFSISFLLGGGGWGEVLGISSMWE